MRFWNITNYLTGLHSIFSAGVALLVLAGAARSQTEGVMLVRSAPRTELEREAQEQTYRAITDVLAAGGVSVSRILFESDAETEAGFWQQVIEKKPGLIITLGTASTRSAINNVERVPVVFSMVLDQLSNLNSVSKAVDISGVTLGIPVRTQLEMLKNALPDIRRVGLIYSRDMKSEQLEAGSILSEMGLRLVSAEIESERDIPSALRRVIPQVDAFWMPLDAVIYEPNIRRFILLECFQNSVPILAVSRQVAEAGTPLALGIDYEDLGRQTAELVLRRLSRGSFSKPVIEHPRKVLLYINESVAASLKLNIPVRVADQAIAVKSGS